MNDNVINFKAAKKRAGYAKKEMKAAENRKKFGRKKTEKRSDSFERDKQIDHLDNHKLDDS